MQQAIYTALTEDEDLMELISGVYDYVPEGTTFPYLVIGDASESTWDCIGKATLPSSEGYKVEHTIYIVSDNSGFKEDLDILVQTERVLNAGTTIAGYTVILDSLMKGTKRDDTNGVRYVPLVAKYIVKKI
jgi:hypothetical protein